MTSRRKRRAAAAAAELSRVGSSSSSAPEITSEPWATLIDDTWTPTPHYHRLVDSLFDYLDSTAPSPLTNTGLLEFDKLKSLQKLGGDEGWEGVPRSVAGYMMQVAWDYLGVPYIIQTDEDGYEYPVLDKSSFRTMELEGSKMDPDDDHREWEMRLNAANIVDPVTRRRITAPIPRSAFPKDAVQDAKSSFDQVIAEAVVEMSKPHETDHCEFYTLRTTSGKIICGVCCNPIVRTRYKCKACFDHNECSDCFVSASSPNPPKASSSS